MSKIFSFHILTILVGFCIMMTKGEEETHPLQKVRKKEEKVRKSKKKGREKEGLTYDLYRNYSQHR